MKKQELTNSQPSKLKSVAKRKTGTTLRITKKDLQNEELANELFLAIRQKTKVRNTFVKNMSKNIKSGKAPVPKITQSGGFLDVFLGKLAGPPMKVAVRLAKDVLVPLPTLASATAIDGAIQRKMCERGVEKAGKRITLIISNEDMADIIRIIKSLEKSGVLVDGGG